MKKFWSTTLALAAVLAVAPFAKADSYYITVNATGGSGGTITGSGTISVGSGGLITDANFNFGGGLTGNLIPITVITGSAPGDVLYDVFDPIDNTSSFTTDQPGNGVNYIGFDNLLTSTIFDYNGILLQLSDGGVLNGEVLNFFYGPDNSAHWDEYGNGNWVTAPQNPPDVTFPAELTITPIPEPSSLSLLGTGLLALAGFLFWKVKTGSIQSA